MEDESGCGRFLTVLLLGSSKQQFGSKKDQVSMPFRPPFSLNRIS